MRGHEPLIAMRSAGKRPSIVFINDYPCQTDWHEMPGDHATICVDGDTPEAIDFRCIFDLRVSITGASEDRAKRLMQACIEAGAVTVGAGSPAKMGAWYEPGWAEIWHRHASEAKAA